MNENSFQWFKQQADEVKAHVELTWPEWMKNTSDIASASFPVVGTSCLEQPVDVKKVYGQSAEE